MAQLGGYAEGTIRFAVAASPLPEHDVAAVLGAEHVRSLTDRYAALAGLLRARIAAVETVHEPVTVDLYIEVLRGLEQDLWFLESHLEREPNVHALRSGRETAAPILAADASAASV